LPEPAVAESVLQHDRGVDAAELFEKRRVLGAACPNLYDIDTRTQERIQVAQVDEFRDCRQAGLLLHSRGDFETLLQFESTVVVGARPGLIDERSQHIDAGVLRHHCRIDRLAFGFDGTWSAEERQSVAADWHTAVDHHDRVILVEVSAGVLVLLSDADDAVDARELEDSTLVHD
jgi:hypothetical protein